MSFISSCTSMDFWISLISYYLCKANSCFGFYTCIQTNGYVYKCMYRQINTQFLNQSRFSIQSKLPKLSISWPFCVELFFLFKTRKLVWLFQCKYLVFLQHPSGHSAPFKAALALQVPSSPRSQPVISAPWPWLPIKVSANICNWFITY